MEQQELERLRTECKELGLELSKKMESSFDEVMERYSLALGLPDSEVSPVTNSVDRAFIKRISELKHLL